MILNLIKIIRVHLIDDCLYFSIFEQIIQVEIKIDVHKMGEKEYLITTNPKVPKDEAVGQI